MQKGFTLIETMVSLALLAFVVLAGARLLGAALAQTRGAALRFRLAEALDNQKNTLASLRWEAGDLAGGDHAGSAPEARFTWRVEDVEPALKRVRLRAAVGRQQLELVLNRSRYILEARP